MIKYCCFSFYPISYYLMIYIVFLPWIFCFSPQCKRFLMMLGIYVCFKKQRHYIANKGLSSQGYGFSSGHVWMWELDCEESWAPKNLWFWIVVLEKTLESPLDCKEVQPVHPKRGQSWVFIGRTDAEAETLILWAPHAKSWFIEKTLMLGGIGDGGEGDDRRWDGWMASPTRWSWVGVNSRSWCWTVRPGVLRFMGS